MSKNPNNNLLMGRLRAGGLDETGKPVNKSFREAYEEEKKRGDFPIRDEGNSTERMLDQQFGR